MRGRALGGLLLVGFLTAGLGCAEQIPPLALNNRAAAHNRKIAKAATEMRTLLLQLQAGKNVRPESVRSAYENVRKTVAEARADMGTVTPNYLPAAQNFY